MTDAREDRLPPQDLHAEQATLGAMMMDEGICVEMLAQLEEDDFYREAHRGIYDAICVAAEEGPVDVVTVGAVLREREQLATVGGAEYLTRLLGEVPTLGHTHRYAQFLADTALRRQLIQFGRELASRAQDNPEDAGDVLSWAAGQIGCYAEARGRDRGAQTAAEIAGSMFEQLEEKLTARPHTSRVRLGLPDLDKQMGGLAGYGLVVPRGLEKAGKSMASQHAALSSATLLAEEDSPQCVVCYLLEGQEVWLERAVAWLAEIDSHLFSPSQFPVGHEMQRFQGAREMWEALPLRLTGQLWDIDDIIMDVRRVAMRDPVGLVLIDYAQLIQGGDGNSETERMEYCANRIAALASEQGCTIIVPSQLTDTGGVRKAKWARAWDEAATFSYDVERGDPDAPREEWAEATHGRFRLHASRRRPPFGVHHVEFDLATGRLTDGTPPIESAGYDE